ncbi:mammaglobin-A-like isoform X1 [Bos indicus]|uniref:Mammaglobin-A-like isoform X1 n=1 Tax=Bos indicus TaxID=9915 RepID=A0ABM4RTJ5_BOSIN|nr:mammaglobin-A isoform X1 [Bos taurus]
MKLVTVLMLVALPLYCYAGSSGCSLLDNVVEKSVDPTVSKDEYRAYLKDFAQTDVEKKAADELKQCFLQQSNETLANFKQIKSYTTVYTVNNSNFLQDLWLRNVNWR